MNSRSKIPTNGQDPKSDGPPGVVVVVVALVGDVSWCRSLFSYSNFLGHATRYRAGRVINGQHRVEDRLDEG